MNPNPNFDPAAWLELADAHGCHPMAMVAENGEMALTIHLPIPPAPSEIYEQYNVNAEAVFDFLVSVDRVVSCGAWITSHEKPRRSV